MSFYKVELVMLHYILFICSRLRDFVCLHGKLCVGTFGAIDNFVKKIQQSKRNHFNFALHEFERIPSRNIKYLETDEIFLSH